MHHWLIGSDQAAQSNDALQLILINSCCSSAIPHGNHSADSRHTSPKPRTQKRTCTFASDAFYRGVRIVRCEPNVSVSEKPGPRFRMMRHHIPDLTMNAP
jgi:hypothetical protein